MIDSKTWATYLARAGVRAQQVVAWSPPFGTTLQAEAFGQGQFELVEFLVQVLHETGFLYRLSENLDYSVGGLLATFGKTKRISEADAQLYGRSPSHPADQKMIANTVYGGTWGKKNLGNTEPDDGWDFRGAGLIQTTGRDNFTYLKNKTGIDVLADSSKLTTPGPDAVTLAIAQWKRLVKPEVLHNEVEVRRAINNGTLGLEDCRVIRDNLRKFMF